MKRTIFGILVLAVGIMMLLRAMGIEQFEWFFETKWQVYILPALVICIALKLIFHRKSHHKHDDHLQVQKNFSTKSGELLKIDARFSGYQYNFDGKNFYGAQINTFLGGVLMDLRDANIEDGSDINVSAFMGGVELYLPQDIRVEVTSSCFCGGVKNVRFFERNENGKVLHIHADCILGGVDIKY